MEVNPNQYKNILYDSQCADIAGYKAGTWYPDSFMSPDPSGQCMSCVSVAWGPGVLSWRHGPANIHTLSTVPTYP